MLSEAVLVLVLESVALEPRRAAEQPIDYEHRFVEHRFGEGEAEMWPITRLPPGDALSSRLRLAVLVA